jgi:succinate dehydrogenase / fumarate reductase cytochrome b subunit
MNINRNQPSPGKLLQWFNPLGRKLSFFGFTLNRVSALGLTLYLYLHLIVLSLLARGPNAYDNFLKLIHNPWFMFGEWLVVAAGLIHGLNGLRIALTSLGIVVPQQKQMFIFLMVIAVIGSLIFAFRMFTTF